MFCNSVYTAFSAKNILKAHRFVAHWLWLISLALMPGGKTMAQVSVPADALIFDFNSHNLDEANGKMKAKAIGYALVDDRFGNPKSAILVQGHYNSYLNLGTSPLLKPGKGSISLWVNFNRRIYSGKGTVYNPIISTRNGPQLDWNVAYSMQYECLSNRLGAATTRDSLLEALITAGEEMKFHEWFHLVMTFDDNVMCFYINGVLNGRTKKGYATVYDPLDSVMLGHSACMKNERYSQAVFDDIVIVNRILNEQEVMDLYKAPNPNKLKNMLADAGRYGTMLLGMALVVLLLYYRYRRKLQQQKVQFELHNRIGNLELRLIKSQMNPHFIFNALNSIKQFIMNKEHESAEKYLTKFAKLVRMLLENNNTENLSLAAEVEMLERYIEMEALRFSHSFHYEVRVDDNILQKETRIPHLMVQPFVENAIWHGLLSKKGERKLSIHFGQPESGTIHCTIDDNGIGREAGSKKETTFKTKSLALSLVKQRLEILSKNMGLDCYVKITDKMEGNKSGGTRVLVVLPVYTNPD